MQRVSLAISVFYAPNKFDAKTEKGSSQSKIRGRSKRQIAAAPFDLLKNGHIRHMLCVFGTLPILHGADRLEFTESLREIAGGGKAQDPGDLGQRQIGLAQKETAFVDPALELVVDRTDAKLLLEGMGQIVFVHMGDLCQMLQGQLLLEMGIDVPPDGGALAIGGREGVLVDCQIDTAHQLGDQNLHIGLADDLVAWLLVEAFLDDVVDAGGDAVVVVVIQDPETVICVLHHGKLQAFNTQHHVLQRGGVVADFRMHHMGVDDDQLMGGDGMELLIDLDVTHAAHHIKQFRVAVGMGDGKPVSGIFGAAHVYQFQGIGNAAGAEGEICVAHTVSSDL